MTEFNAAVFICVNAPLEIQTPTVSSAGKVPVRFGASGSYSRLRRNASEIYSYLRTGTFDEYAAVPEPVLVKIREDTSLAEASLGRAVTAGIGAVIRTARVEPGSTVPVKGHRSVGTNVVKRVLLSGPKPVIVRDLDDDRLEIAQVKIVLEHSVQDRIYLDSRFPGAT